MKTFKIQLRNKKIMQICEHLLPANKVVNSHRIEKMKKSPNIVDLIFTMIRVRPCQKLETK